MASETSHSKQLWFSEGKSVDTPDTILRNRDGTWRDLTLHLPSGDVELCVDVGKNGAQFAEERDPWQTGLGPWAGTCEGGVPSAASTRAPRPSPGRGDAWGGGMAMANGVH